MKKYILSGIALCSLAISANAQMLTDSSRAAEPLRASVDSVASTDGGDRKGFPAWHEMFTRIPGDWKAFGVDNFRFERLPAIAGLAGLTAGLILADHATWNATSNFSNASTGRREFKEILVSLGDGKSVLALAGGFGVVGLVIHDARAVRTASQVVESYLACGLTVQLLKHLAGRERPERQSRQGGRWRPFPNQSDYLRAVPRYDSFPSGHTAAAMAAVTVVIENYPEIKWLRPVGYGIVGLVGFGLVSKGWHWYSDLPLAIVLGHQFGKIAVHRQSAEESDDSSLTKLTVAPAIGQDGAGVVVTFSF